MPDRLEEVIKRVVAGSCNEADIQAIATALQSGQLSLVAGSRAAGIAGDATNAIIITGDNNLIVQGQVAESLQAVLERFNLQEAAVTSVDELVQQVRSSCCDKIKGTWRSEVRLQTRKQVRINQLYVDVYILEELTDSIITDTSALLEDFDLESDRLHFERKKNRLSGFKEVDVNHNLMILGKPGSGKTTFLQYLAVACCKGEFQPTRIPILISLRELTELEQFNLVDQIHQEFELTSKSETEKILKTGTLLLLIDGLDEVSEKTRQIIQNGIQKFSDGYYKNKIIITCRMQGFKGYLRGFKYIQIADFTQEQVERFAHSWFTTTLEQFDQGKFKAQKFIKELSQPENKQIADLVVTPLLLDLTCLVFNGYGSLPLDRVDLYRRGVKLLLEKWDKDRNISRVVHEKLKVEGAIQRLLGDLATRKFKQEQYALFNVNEIQAYISSHLSISKEESLKVLKSIEENHGLLVERASNIYSFSHLTFQEYFAATWLCDRQNWQGISGIFTEQRWQDVLSITLQLEDANPDRLAQTIKSEIDNLLNTDSTLQKFLTWLAKKEQSVSAKVSYKPAKIRDFYFTHAKFQVLDKLGYVINYTSDVGIDNSFDDCIKKFRSTTIPRQLYYKHTIEREIVDAADLGFDDALNHALVFALALDQVLTNRVAHVSNNIGSKTIVLLNWFRAFVCAVVAMCYIFYIKINETRNSSSERASIDPSNKAEEAPRISSELAKTHKVYPEIILSSANKVINILTDRNNLSVYFNLTRERFIELLHDFYSNQSLPSTNFSRSENETEDISEADLELLYNSLPLLPDGYAVTLASKLKTILKRALEIDNKLRKSSISKVVNNLTFKIFHGSNETSLETSLKKLQKQISEIPLEYTALKDWWGKNGQAWKEQLRESIKHRDIGHDWKFSQDETERLKHYYNASRFLMNNLKESKVSSEVLQDIEKTLLLPIVEIEKRKREKVE